MQISHESSITATLDAQAIIPSKNDTVWMLGLYGTAIGAGTLFLPINAGIGGFWPLIMMACLALPMTYFAHRALCRFVLSGSKREDDITDVVKEHFNPLLSQWVTFLYFFAIYPILLMYSVAITNTVQSFIVNQLGMSMVPRSVLSLCLILMLVGIARYGEHLTVKAMSILVYPFVCSLLLMAFYLMPHWNLAFIRESSPIGHAITTWTFYKTLWLAIPVMVFSFNHSPIISSFAVHEKRLHGNKAERYAARILLRSHILMVVSVMFFVFSCVFSLSSADLMAAKTENISVLSYLANHFHTPVIEWLAPLIAFVAISKSFLGHYLGAREGFNGLVVKKLEKRGKGVNKNKLNNYTAIFMITTTWIVATYNPSILGMIETLGGPIIALLLFIMPLYAIKTIPAMRQYANDRSNRFVLAIGLIALSAIFYGLC